MSIKTVAQGIKVATRDRHVTKDELKENVIGAAEGKGPVTDGEIAKIGKFTKPMFDLLGCFPPYSYEEGAPATANDFFSRYGAPYGDNLKAVEKEIRAAMERGEGEACPPPSKNLMKHLHEVPIDQNPIPGGPFRTAYVSCDTRNKGGRYALVRTSGCFGSTWRKITLGPPNTKPTEETKQQVAEAFLATQLLGVASNAVWSQRHPDEETVSFPVVAAREGPMPRSPYGPSYSVHVPKNDPNGSDYFYASKSIMCRPPAYTGPIAKSLPQGFFTMTAVPQDGFGCVPPGVTIHGEMNNVGYKPKFEASAPDENGVITVKAKASYDRPGGPVIAIAAPYEHHVPLAHLPRQNYVVKIIDEDGRLLRACALNLSRDVRPY